MMGGFGMVLWWIIGIIVLIAIILPLSKGFNQNNRYNQEPQKTALTILKERYARGEIDKTEFEERKKVLMYN